jgi:hypothetical protein
MRGSRPLPAETVDYLARVLRVASLPVGPLTIRVKDSVVLRGPFVMRESQPQSTGSTLDRPPHNTPFVELAHTRQPLEQHVGVQPDVQSK